MVPVNTGKLREISRIKFYHFCGCSGTGLYPSTWEVEVEGSEISPGLPSGLQIGLCIVQAKLKEPLFGDGVLYWVQAGQTENPNSVTHSHSKLFIRLLRHQD